VEAATGKERKERPRRAKLDTLEPDLKTANTINGIGRMKYV
jgi:hypothetical protein